MAVRYPGGLADLSGQVRLRLRETTLKSYAVCLMTYFGYLAHVVGRTPTWDDCFDVESLEEFVRWHGVRGASP